MSLDTTTGVGSVALVEHDRILSERPGDPSRTYGERLPGEILSLLDAYRLRPSDIDLFAVASGPGSFTGMRVGIATIQGLAFVQGRRVAVVPTLEAIARSATAGLPAGALVGVWIDARRRDIFSALYQLTSNPPFDPGRLVELDPPAVDDPRATLARWRRIVDSAILFAGDGAVLYRDVIRACDPGGHIIDVPPLAGVIGLMAAARSRVGDTMDPAEVRPMYVRRPDAEVEREKRDPPPPETQRR